MTLSPLHNWQLKIISLLCAVGLWFFVVGIENTVYVFPESFQVKSHNLGEGISLAAALPEVKIYVNTNGKDIKTVSKNDFEAFVDLSGLGEGIYELPVMASSQNAQAAVLKTDPEKIKVLLAPVGEKEVQVKADAAGSPAQGYGVREIKTEPAVVKVTAADSYLENLRSLEAAVTLQGFETSDATFTVEPKLPAYPDAPANVKIEPQQVTAYVLIAPLTAEKTLTINPVVAGGENADLIKKQVIVMPSSVTVTGEQNLLKDLTQVNTAPIAADSLLSLNGRLPVRLDLPEGLELKDKTAVITVKLLSDKF